MSGSENHPQQKHYDAALRQVRRKYGRQRRKERAKQRFGNLPLRIGLLVLAAATAVAVWFATQPKPVKDLPDRLRVFIFDVGQGDAALIQTPEHAVLMDAGEAEQGYPLVHKLKSLGVRKLDAAICSHPHEDHMGGMETVLQCIPTETLYLPQIPDELVPTTVSFSRMLETAQTKHTAVRTPACRDSLALGDTELTFLSTDNNAFEALNNCSLGCRITCGTASFFFAGDLEEDGENAMLQAGLLEPVTVLKVSHHGSSTSSSQAFLDAVKPQYAAISVASMNDYGHPTQKILNRLAAIPCTIYRTDLDDTIAFATDGTGIHVVTHWDFGK